MPPEMTRERKERCIFFAHAVKDANRRMTATQQSKDPTTGTPKLSLQRLDVLRGQTKVLFEQFF